MTIKTFLDCERKSLAKMKNYQLPPVFKKIGLAIAIFSFISLFANKFTLDEKAFRTLAKYGLLIGTLMVSISKEAIEDEMIANLRMQSYTFAFVMGVGYVLVLPLIDFFVDMAFKAEEAKLNDLGDFEILWILLSIQVFYFEYLKRLN